MSAPTLGDELLIFRKYAMVVADGGYHLVRVKPRSKATDQKCWTDCCATALPRVLVAQWPEKHPDYGIGIPCGHKVSAIDIDERDPERADAIEAITRAILGPSAPMRIG